MVAAIWVTLAVCAPAEAAEASRDRFLVVVNASNRTSGPDEDLRALVRQLYLGEQTSWPDEVPVMPLARPDASVAMRAFTNVLLGLDFDQLQAHWRDSGRPRPEVVMDVRDLLQRVSRDAGAFGMLVGTEADKLPAKVRVLLDFGTPTVDDAYSPAELEAALSQDRDSTEAALKRYIEESDQPYGKRLRELLTHEIIQELDGGALVEVPYISWDSPFMKQELIARLEPDGLALYDPSEKSRLAALPTTVPEGATPPRDEAAVTSQAPTTAPQSFEGHWKAESGGWIANLVIEDGSFEFEATCSSGITVRLRGVGELEPDGSLPKTYLRPLGGFWDVSTVVKGPLSNMWMGPMSHFINCFEANFAARRVGPEPSDALTEERVLAYLDDNDREMSLKLRDYIDQNRDSVPRYTGSTENKTRIFAAKVVRLDGDVAITELNYDHGHLKYPGFYVNETFVFHLKWVDDELIFVGHEPPGSSGRTDRPDGGSLDGRREAETSGWTASLEIEDGEFEFRAVCESANVVLRGEGRLGSDGSLQKTYLRSI